MRTSDWLKIKARLQQEFVVGGFTEGKGSRQRLGALLLGAYRNGKFHYFGHSGSGFSILTNICCMVADPLKGATDKDEIQVTGHVFRIC
jgi:ATP-dependent DNA ligase